MVENYPDDKSTRCFIFKGKSWRFDGLEIEDSDKFYTYFTRAITFPLYEFIFVCLAP